MCQYCEHENNDFMILNETTDYSGIEMALNRQGVFRVRYYTEGDIWFSEDVINIKHCPMCSREFSN